MTGIQKPEIAIVGLGYVGLPTALAFHAAGCRVVGIDINQDRLRRITAERVDLIESDRTRLAEALHSDRFQLTGDIDRLSSADGVLICVPTPVDGYLMPDLSLLRAACDHVVGHLVPGQVVLLTSTTYVGSTHDLLVEPLERRGFTIGEDVYVAFSPERIDPGNVTFVQERVPRVVGGVTPECTRRAADLLSAYLHTVHVVSSCEAAELTKLYENTFRAVNISLANELTEVAGAFGLDVIEVIDAAATKPFGFMPFYPGPGVGGHCVPCDPHYLLWQLRSKRVEAPVVERAMMDIAARPRRVVERAREVLSDLGLGLAGARVLVMGVTYKPDVEDIRETPALQIIDELAEAGADVSYSDPYIRHLRLPHTSGAEGKVPRVEDPAAQGWDLVLVHTKHRDVDYDWLIDAPCVLDATYRLKHSPNVHVV